LDQIIGFTIVSYTYIMHYGDAMDDAAAAGQPGIGGQCKSLFGRLAGKNRS
jgi:hypothetical protein